MCEIYGCGQANEKRGPIPDEQRRSFIKGLIGLPLAVILADPVLAQAAASKGSEVSIDLEDGEKATGYLAMPSAASSAPTVLLIHEWWGLNDQIKAVANDLAEKGYVALAIDLYQGKVATTREQANELRLGMDSDWATEAMMGFVGWLRAHPQGNGKVATMGWCFGGGWSLNGSIAAPVDATVIYYGNVVKDAEQLRHLNGPVLGHFGTLDKNINKEMVEHFEQQMTAAGKVYTHYWYEADHAFANPSGARYDEGDAKEAWSRTLSFLEMHLK